jgi:uncharacterized protein YuzE
MQFRLDVEANALYIAIKPGTVARTIELTDLVYVDVDATGEPLGIEFVSADEFVPFLRRLTTLEHDHEWQSPIPAEVGAVFVASAA